MSSQHKVGIDIEYVKKNFEWFNIVEKYFSLNEMLYLEALSKDDQVKAFLNIWTCKEALLKAKGIGLSGIEDRINSESTLGE